MVAALVLILFLLASPAGLAKSADAAEALYEKAVSETEEMASQDQALKDIDMAIKTSPTRARYYAARAAILYRLEEDEAAVAAANKATSLDPKLYKAWWEKAKAQARLKQLDDALKSADTALTLAPAMVRLYIYGTRSHIMTLVNRWEDAEKDLDIQLKGQPGLGSGYIDRIAVCEHLHEWPKVIADCTYLLKYDHQHDGHVYRCRGRAYAQVHDYKNAVKDLKSALSMWPDDYRIHSELKAVYIQMGDKKGVVEEEAKIQSLNRDMR